MDKISQDAKVEKKSLYQQLKLEKPNAEKQELKDEVKEIERKRCQSNFKAMKRAEIEFAQRNRTQTPSVGHYTPRWDIFQKEARANKFLPLR